MAARAADLAGAVEHARAAGATSLREIAAELNKQGVPTARGCAWTAAAVDRLLRQISAAEPAPAPKPVLPSLPPASAPVTPARARILRGEPRRRPTAEEVKAIADRAERRSR